MLELLNALTIMAAEDPTGGDAPPNPFGNVFLMMAVVFALFYFIVLRPQNKERKNRQTQLDTLAKGDKIVTVGGMHGSVTKIGKGGETVEVEVARNVRLTFNRTAVGSITKRGKGKGDKDGEDED